jgi:hypothetical protein
MLHRGGISLPSPSVICTTHGREDSVVACGVRIDVLWRSGGASLKACHPVLDWCHQAKKTGLNVYF